jgi:hypothetical protein
MRYKLNLHAHSNFSDGGFSVKRIAEKYQELGFNTLVLTDHYYGMGPKKEAFSRDFDSSHRKSITLDREKLNLLRRQAKNITEKLGMGCIIGIEIGINKLEEVCVFGSDAIDAIFDLREERQDMGPDDTINISDLVDIRAKHPCMINLCHPGRPDVWVENNGHHILDGFEYIHAGTLMFDRFKKESGKHERPIPDEMRHLIKLSNSDAHSIECLDWNWNEVEEDIREEHHLIQYVNDKKPFYTISRLRDNW